MERALPTCGNVMYMYDIYWLSLAVETTGHTYRHTVWLCSITIDIACLGNVQFYRQENLTKIFWLRDTCSISSTTSVDRGLRNVYCKSLRDTCSISSTTSVDRGLRNVYCKSLKNSYLKLFQQDRSYTTWKQYTNLYIMYPYRESSISVQWRCFQIVNIMFRSWEIAI